MAQSIRTLKNRIRSVEGIRKMTRAMEMVSSAKLRSLQKELYTLKEYFRRSQEILSRVLSGRADITHPLLEQIPDKRAILLAVVTSDTGLCGNYNSAVIRLAEEFMRKHSDSKISLVCVGKKGLGHFKNSGAAIAAAHTELYGHYSSAAADKISQELTGGFSSGAFNEVYAVYMSYESASRHVPALEKILAVEIQNTPAAQGYLAEPDIKTILDELLPLYIKSKIRTVLLSAFTAEHAVRVMAMHEATDNAGDLLTELVLTRNKMRQAAITGEIIEVISSADALKGQ